MKKNIYNKYGIATVKTAQELNSSSSVTEAYSLSIKGVFETKSSQEKSCPRNAFLGLCEAGLVKGIPKGDYTKSVKNKEYALKAIDILKKNAETTFSPIELWKKLELGDKRP
jgi:hypothetical protein